MVRWVYEVEHLTWFLQSLDLNVIKPLSVLLENKVRVWFILPRTLHELKTALHEEWVLISLNFVHDLYLSILRRMQAVLKAIGASTQY